MAVSRNFKNGPYRPWGGRQAFFVKKNYKPVLGQRDAGARRQGPLLYISPHPHSLLI